MAKESWPSYDTKNVREGRKARNGSKRKPKRLPNAGLGEGLREASSLMKRSQEKGNALGVCSEAVPGKGQTVVAGSAK